MSQPKQINDIKSVFLDLLAELVAKAHMLRINDEECLAQSKSAPRLGGTSPSEIGVGNSNNGEFPADAPNPIGTSFAIERFA